MSLINKLPGNMLFGRHQDSKEWRSSSMAAVGTTGAVLASAGLYWWYTQQQQRRQGEEQKQASSPLRRRRRWSFTSVSMMDGGFPEHAKVPEHIVNAALFLAHDAKVPSNQELAEAIVKPLLEYERLGKVPTIEGVTKCLDEDSDTALPIPPHYMVRRISFTGATEHDVHDMIFKHLQDPLQSPRSVHVDDDQVVTMALPWWELLVLENTITTTSINDSNGGGSVLVLRFHHALADGISLVKAFFDSGVVQNEKGQPLPLPDLAQRYFIASDDGSNETKDNVVSLTAASNNNNNKTSQHPSTITTKANEKKRNMPSLWTILREWWHCLTLGMSSFDHDTAFSKSIHGRMTHSNHRAPVVFPTLPLDFIKGLKNAASSLKQTSVTINDIVLTAVSQAIFDYCISQNCPLVQNQQDSSTQKKNKIQCRALMPISLPRRMSTSFYSTTSSVGDDDSDGGNKTSKRTINRNLDEDLTNQFSMVSTDLAVDCQDIMERLQQIRKTTAALKSSPRPAIQLALQNTLAAQLPSFLSKQTAYDVFVRHSLVFSNVPGPTEPCYLAGCHIKGLQMFFGNLVPQCGFLSYDGNLYGNFVLDPDAIPNSESLAHFYGRAMIQLAARLNLAEEEVPESLNEFCGGFTTEDAAVERRRP